MESLLQLISIVLIGFIALTRRKWLTVPSRPVSLPAEGDDRPESGTSPRIVAVPGVRGYD